MITRSHSRLPPAHSAPRVPFSSGASSLSPRLSVSLSIPILFVPSRPLPLFLLVGLILSLPALSRSQTTLYWDANGTNSGGTDAGNNTATGNWGTSSFWSSSQAGTSATSTWIADRNAVFSAGTDVTGSYTVSVTSIVDIGNLTFSAGAVTVAGSGRLRFDDITITTDSGRTATLQALLEGDTITKAGSGTLVLSGASDFRGSLTVSGGSVHLGDTTGSPLKAVGSLASGSTLKLIGTSGDLIDDDAHLRNLNGTFDLNGAEETVGDISGTGAIANTGTSGATLTVTGAASEPFSGTISRGSSAMTLVKSGGGTLTLSGTGDNNGLNLQITGSTGTVLLAKTSSSSVHAADNITSVVNGATLRLDGTGGDQILDSGGITNLNGIFDLNGRSETIGKLSGSGIIDNASLSAVTLTVGAGDATGGDLTFTGSLRNSNAELALNKIGTGTLTLSSQSVYTGATTITGGAISINAENRLGANPATFRAGQLTLDGGTLATTATFAIDDTRRGITVGTGGGTFEVASGTTLTVSANNVVTGAGALAKTGAGALILNSASTYAGATTIGAGTLTLGAGERLPDTTALTFHNVAGATLNLAGYNETIGSLAGGGTTGGTVTLGGGTLTVGGDGTNTTFAGTTAATAGALVKTGAGTLTLTGTHLHTGGLTVAQGALRAESAAALGDGPLALSGGSLQLAGDAGFGFIRPTTVTADTTITTTRLTAGAGVNHTLHTLDLGAHRLTVVADAATTSGSAGVTFGATTLANGAELRADSAAAQLTLGSVTGTNASFTVSGIGNILLGGPINTGTGSLTKTGPGTLTLSGGSNYTGSTFLNEGTLALSSSSSFVTSGPLVIDGGTFSMGSHSESVNGLVLHAGAVTASTGSLSLLTGIFDVRSGSIGASLVNGHLLKTTSGTVTLSASNTYSGNTTVSAGTLALSGNGRLSNSTTLIVNGGTFDLGGVSDTVGDVTLESGTITGSGTLSSNRDDFDLRSGTVAAPLGGSRGLSKTTAGTVTLSAANLYTGTTTVTAGTLALSGQGSLPDAGTLTINGGTFDLGSVNDTVGAVTLQSGNITGTGTLTLNSGTFAVQSGTVSAPLGGSAGLTKTTPGTVTLTGPSSYAGSTTVSEGTLVMGAAGALPVGNSLTLDSGGVLDFGQFNYTAGAVSLPGGTLLGTGTLTLDTGDFVAKSAVIYPALAGSAGLRLATGAHTVYLHGAGSFTGTTSVSNGTLSLEHPNAIAGSTLALTSTGMISFSGLSTVNLGGLSGTRGFSITNSLSAPVALSVGSNHATTLYSGAISGSGSLTKVGNGTLTLSGNHTFTGGTTVSAGTLALGASERLPNNRHLHLNGGTFALGAFNETVGTLTLESGTISGSGQLALSNSWEVFDVRSGTIAAQLSGATALAKTGDGTVILSGANAYTGSTTISQGTLQLGAATALPSASAVTINGGTLDLGGFDPSVGNWTLASGSIAGTGTLLINASPFAVHAGEIRVPLSGSSGLVKSTAGTVSLHHAGTFTGTTTVTEGTLRLEHSHALAGSTFVRTGGDLAFATGIVTAHLAGLGGSSGFGLVNVTGAPVELLVGGTNASSTFSGSLTSVGSLTKVGAGTLTLGGANSFVGTTTIREGTLALTGSGRIGNASAVIVEGGTFAVGVSDTVGAVTLLSGTISGASGMLTLDSGNFDARSGTISTRLGGPAGLVKDGSGTVTLSGANTYTGSTAVNQGTLALSGSGQLADTGALVVNGGTFDLGSVNDTVGSVTLQSGSLGGSGLLTLNNGNFDLQSGTASARLAGSAGLMKTTAGTVTLTGNNTFTGVTTVRNGVLALSGAGRLANNSALRVEGGTFDLGSVSDTVGPVTLMSGNISGSGTLTSSSFSVESGAISAPLAGSGGLTKTSAAGTVTLSGANSYTGTTTVSGGTLVMGSADALPASRALTINGGTLDIGAFNHTAGLLTLVSGTITGTGALTSDSIYPLQLESGNIYTPLTGSISLIKYTAGTLTLHGPGIFTGATMLSEGILRIEHSDVLAQSRVDLGDVGGTFSFGGLTAAKFGGLSGSRNLALANLTSAPVALTVDSTSATNYSGGLSGAGSLTKLGSFSLTLSGTNTYTGTTTINAGTLTLSGGNALANTSAVTLANTTGANLALSTSEAIGSLAGGGTSGGEVILGTSSLTVGADNTSTTFAGVISGSGALTKTGTGTLTLSGSNTFTGATTINAGTLTLSGGNALADTSAVTLANVAGARLTLSANETIGSLAGGGTAGGNVTLGTRTLTAGGDNTSTTFAGVISGSGALTKQGTGTLTLSGTNTHTGGTTISAGTVLVTGRLSGDVQTASGTTFQTASTVLITGSAGSSGDAYNETNGGGGSTLFSVSGGGTFVNQGSATGGAGGAGASSISSGSGFFELFFPGSHGGDGGDGVSLGTGTVINNLGTVRGGAGGAASYGPKQGGAGGIGLLADVSVAITNSGTLAGGRGGNHSGTSSTAAAGSGGAGLSAGASSSITNSGTILGGDGGNASSGVPGNGGTGVILASGGTLTNTGAITGGDGGTTSSTASGGAALVATNATIVNSGTLTGGTNSSGTRANAVVLQGTTNTLELRAGFQIVGNVSGNSGNDTVVLGGEANATLAGAQFIGIEKLKKTGASTWTVLGTFNGATTIDTGTLQVGTSATSGSLSGSIANHSALIFASHDSTFATGNISGSGALTKTGAGTLTLSGFNSFTGATTINAGTLTLSGGNALSNTSAVTLAPTFGVTLALSTGETIGSLSGGGTTGGNVTLGANTLTVGADNTSTTFAGGISGSGAVIKTGSGTLTLSGSNTFTGTTTINTGTLAVSGGNALADTSAVTLANTASATLTLSTNETIGSLAGGGTTGGNVSLGSSTLTLGGTNASTTYAGNISGSSTSALVKNGTGTLTLSGNNSFTGTTTINAGALTLSGGNALADTSPVTLANTAGATLALSANETIGSLAGGGVTGGNVSLTFRTLTVGADNTSTTFAGRISDSGAVIKTGSGTLTLSGSNTYTGTTTVNAGTLTLSGGNALADTAAVTLADATGATLALSTNETIGSLSGGGLTGGNVDLGSSTLTVFQTTSTTYAGIISGTGGSLTKTSSGTLTLSGANTYDGLTTVSGGTLILNGSNTSASGGVRVNTGATVNVGHDSALGTGLLTLNGGTLTASGAPRTLANPFSLTANSTLSGTHAITFNGPGTLNGLFSLTVGTGTTATLNAALGESTSSVLTKLGAGTLAFKAANTYTGGTTISAGTASLGNATGSAFGTGPVVVNYGATLTGTGSFSGALTLRGRISPGNSPGTQSTGSQTWNGLASYDWELNRVAGTKGNDPGWDWLNIAGTLTIASTSGSPFALNLLSLTSANATGNVIDFNSSLNSSYTIATASGGIFGFDTSKFSINTAGFSNSLNGGSWSLSLGNSNTDLNLNFITASAIPEPSTYAAIFGAVTLALAVHRRRRK